MYMQVLYEPGLLSVRFEHASTLLPLSLVIMNLARGWVFCAILRGYSKRSISTINIIILSKLGKRKAVMNHILNINQLHTRHQ